jgi:hypothetical protein
MMMDKDAIAKDVEYIRSVAQENSEFLLENMKDCYNEVVELIDDAIDFDLQFIKNENWNYYYTNFSMVYFGSHVLMPMSFALRIDLLVGNIPACFFELRLILESMVKCYWADLCFPEKDNVSNKLQSLEDTICKKKTISRLHEEMGEDYLALWKDLSREWVHTEGFVKRILKEASKTNGVLAYALASPMSYNETDIDVIKDLCLSVSKFRNLLKETIDRWNKNIEPSS